MQSQGVAQSAGAQAVMANPQPSTASAYGLPGMTRSVIIEASL
jgi:hypothetical protein